MKSALSFRRRYTRRPPSEAIAGTINVLHVIESLGSGGAERLLHTNLQYLDQKRVRSVVVTLCADGDHWVEPIKELGVEVVTLKCATRGELAGAVGALVRISRARQTHLIHTHLFWANILGRIAGLLSGIPVISSIHNPEYEPQVWENSPSASRGKVKFCAFADRWTALCACDRMIAVSEFVRQSAARHLKFPVEHIDLLYNPVDMSELDAPITRSRRDLIREWQLPDDCAVLLNVARVAPQKGLVHAVRAMPEVVRQFPNAQLVSVGALTDSRYVERIRREATALGVADRVHLLGPRRDIGSLLRACDVFLFPSNYEGQGIALVEAMATGCACIASDIGPMKELLVDGVTGRLVPPGDPSGLAAAVCELLSRPDLRQRLGAAARESAVMRFQPVPSTERLVRIYETVLAVRNGQSWPMQ